MNISPISEISGNFLFGMDISSLIVMENAGFKFHNHEGMEDDLLNILKESGVNMVRVKIWNDPYDKDGNGYGGGNSDLAKALLIAGRAQKYGIKLLLDFHYSDFWSDPARQLAPKEWKSFNIEEKADALYKFTFHCLEELHKTRAEISIIQIGNEINHGLAGEHEYKEKCTLIKAGIKAIKDFNRTFKTDILSAVHFTDPDKGFEYICEYLKDNDVDYDVFGCSFYATWHGNSKCLVPSLKHIVETYNKKVMILETAWPHDMPPANLIYTYGYVDFEVSVQGQIDFMEDIIYELSKLGDDALGISYWEPAWLNTTEEEWNRYGTGWASKYAGAYDNEAKDNEGVSGVDEQSLFYADGYDIYPLPSVNIYNIVKYGKVLSDKK